MENPFLAVIFQVLPEPHASLLGGMLFGSKSAMLPPDLKEMLINTGTIHIVALSGQNISILIRLFSEATLWLGRRVSIGISFIGIVGFIILVGGEPTLIRAAIMGSISLIAVYFGRQSWSLLSLILAAGIMLIIYPGWIDTISFQLSFAATLGIILLVPPMRSRSKGLTMQFINDLLQALHITLAAQLFTLPIIVLHFERVSLISPLTNILISWSIMPLMVFGIAVSIIGILSLSLAQIVSWICWALLSYLLFIVEVTARLPFASINL